MEQVRTSQPHNMMWKWLCAWMHVDVERWSICMKFMLKRVNLALTYRIALAYSKLWYQSDSLFIILYLWNVCWQNTKCVWIYSTSSSWIHLLSGDGTETKKERKSMNSLCNGLGIWMRKGITNMGEKEYYNRSICIAKYSKYAHIYNIHSANKRARITENKQKLK